VIRAPPNRDRGKRGFLTKLSPAETHVIEHRLLLAPIATKD
jgi:hypothetical protein